MTEITWPRTWVTEQFESMSWHDNHVHAFRLQEGEWGSGKLILDIDYILEWVRVESRMKFRIVPARLAFLNVSELRVSLDYAASSAAHGPFSIHQIMRRSETRERYVAQIWSILINWPKGEFEFVATGFEQTAVGEAILCDGQLLEREKRKSIVI